MKGIEEQARKRFVKEAKYQQQIEHPNIVKIIDVDTKIWIICILCKKYHQK